MRVIPKRWKALVRHDWPGNVRELANVLERAQILAEENLITLDDLPDILVESGGPPPAAPGASPMDCAKSSGATC